MNDLPAIVLMLFNRPEKTKVVLDQILKAQPRKLYVVADGPRVGHPEDLNLVAKTRSLIDSAPEGMEIIRLYADANLGLRTRILTGLDEVFFNEEQAIIIEDDCRPSVSFFHFASELLTRYGNSSVGVVAGSNFGPYHGRQASYHFSRSPYIWGWATWSEVWKRFRADEQRESWTDEEVRNIMQGFSVKREAKEFQALMKNAQRLNTWDVSFAVWLRQQSLVSAVPARNLIQNIGFGEGATHTIFENFDVNLPAEELAFPLRHPSSLEPDLRREKIMWLRKQARWLSFPLLHPVDFSGRIIRYLRHRPEQPCSKSG